MRTSLVLLIILCATALSAPAAAQVPSIPQPRPGTTPTTLSPPATPVLVNPSELNPGKLNNPLNNPALGVKPLQLPPSVKIVRYSSAGRGIPQLYQGTPMELVLEFTGLTPGKVFLSVDPAKDPAGSVSLLSERVSQSDPSTIRHTVGADGVLRMTLVAVFNHGHAVPSGGVKLHLRAQHEGFPTVQTVEFSTRTLQVTPMKVHIAAVPPDIIDRIGLGGWVYSDGSRDTGFGCAGPPTVMSRKDIGAFADGGKLRIRTRSSPLGSRCPRESYRKELLLFPWRAVAVKFSSSTSDRTRCWLVTPFPFLDEREQGTVEMAPGRVAFVKDVNGLEYLPRMVVFTQCTNTLFDDQFVEMRWDHIELLGPVNGNPAEAWR